MPQSPLWNREEVEARLLARINYERNPRAAAFPELVFRLDRMRRFAELLGNPHRKYAVLHVAGTKGKGSTAAMLATVLSRAGYRCGLYTSPHLEQVEERLAVDGGICTAEEFTQLAAEVWPVVEQLDSEAAAAEETGPTFFEIITAMAFLHFARAAVDFAVLETGLGGRLDSTNICEPAVAVITSVSYDHTRQLGATLPLIAREKAGIIKPGVPVVSGVRCPEAGPVIEEKAARVGAPLYLAERDFSVRYRPARGRDAAGCFGGFEYRDGIGKTPWRLEDMRLGLPGAHQAENAAAALAALHLLADSGKTLPEEAIRRGLAETRVPGRVELFGTGPVAVLDVAHNAASTAALVRTLEELALPPRRTLVLAISRDKDARAILANLLPHFSRIITTRFQGNPRGRPAEELAALAVELGGAAGVPVECAATPLEAWRRATAGWGEHDLVCVAGSLFLAAELRRQIAAELPAPALAPC